MYCGTVVFIDNNQTRRTERYCCPESVTSMAEAVHKIVNCVVEGWMILECDIEEVHVFNTYSVCLTDEDDEAEEESVQDKE